MQLVYFLSGIELKRVQVCMHKSRFSSAQTAKGHVNQLTLFTATCPRPKLDYAKNDRYRSDRRFLRILCGDAWLTLL